MSLRYPAILASAALITLFSCNMRDNTRSHGSIRLGDSSTIVTETDSQYLRDLVTDFNPTIPEHTEEPASDTASKPAPQQATDTTTAPAQATAQPTAEEKPKQEATQPQGNGLTVAFKDVTIFIPGITVKTYRTQNLEKANGASYQLTGGKLPGNQIKITSGTVTKVSQRYQTVVMIKNSLGTLPLDALNSTTDWQALPGGRNGYNITGLDSRHLQYSRANNAQIKKALERAMRAHRISRRKEREWLNSIARVRAVNQPPLSVTLRSVMWKIEGKDARGRSFQKQVRIDLPI